MQKGIRQCFYRGMMPIKKCCYLFMWYLISSAASLKKNKYETGVVTISFLKPATPAILLQWSAKFQGNLNLAAVHSLLMVLCSGRDVIVLPIVIRSADGCLAKFLSPNWCPLNFDHFSLRKCSTLSSQRHLKSKMNAEFNWNPVSPSGYWAYFGHFCVCKNRRSIFALL